jgi:hypothetical protein
MLAALPVVLMSPQIFLGAHGKRDRTAFLCARLQLDILAVGNRVDEATQHGLGIVARGECLLQRDISRRAETEPARLSPKLITEEPRTRLRAGDLQIKPAVNEVLSGGDEPVDLGLLEHLTILQTADATYNTMVRNGAH